MIDQESDKTGKTRTRGSVDQQVQEHKLRWWELPTEPRMGQVTYWRQKPVVSPDKELRTEVEMLINNCFQL